MMAIRFLDKVGKEGKGWKTQKTNAEYITMVEEEFNLGNMTPVDRDFFMRISGALFSE